MRMEKREEQDRGREVRGRERDDHFWSFKYAYTYTDHIWALPVPPMSLTSYFKHL